MRLLRTDADILMAVSGEPTGRASEEWTLYRSVAPGHSWRVMAMPAMPLPDGYETVRVVPAAVAAEAQREREEARADTERYRKLVDRYRRPMVDDGVKPADRLHVLKVRAVDAEERAAEASRRLEEAEAALQGLVEWIDSDSWQIRGPSEHRMVRFTATTPELLAARRFLARVSSEGVSSGATSERNEHG
jgi:hypothetical protein